MKKSPILLTTLILAMSFLLWSCEEAKNPVGVAPATKSLSRAAGPSQVLSLTDTSLAGFRVTFDSVRFVNNQSTFYYTASRQTAAQIAFRIEFPARAGAPTAWSTDNNPNTTGDAFCSISSGITWNPSTPQVIYYFSVTYPGKYNILPVQVGVKSTSTTECGNIAGVGVRVYDISGTVFTDADENGIRGASETGIGDVKVRLKSGGTSIDSVITNATGNYIFEAFPAGTYEVEVDTSSVAATSTKYLAATTATSKTVTVGPNSTGNDFGFAPRRAQLINDLKFGVLQTFGESASFWKKQLQVAVSGKGTAEIPADSLIAYVARIRALLLPDPFTLPGGNGLQAALDLLSRPVKTDLDKLVRELLASEFNYVSGRGVTTGTTPDPELHLFLLGWGEALVNSLGGITPFAAGTTSSSTEDAITIFTQLNSSGGGSGSK